MATISCEEDEEEQIIPYPKKVNALKMNQTKMYMLAMMPKRERLSKRLRQRAGRN